ncbi:MAG: aldo/keto reductase [Lentisphaeraceae bacterium]|nr:aldo/keto reductase [Lentisphaeraceae bacterium]
MKLALGTVQFGIDYGISNKSGQSSLEEVRAILAYAQSKGIDVLDTAHSYGESETVLGKSEKTSKFKIVTKTKTFDKVKRITSKSGKQFKEVFFQSLKKLNVDAVYGLMVHHAEDLLKPGSELLFETIRSFKDQGLVQKIGVSAYHERQIRQILKNYTIDIIQIPVSILDQRLIQNGVLKDLKSLGVEVHTRSAFLQGLIFVNPKNLSSHFDGVKPLLERFQLTLKQEECSAIEAALGFLGQFKEIDRVVCGVTSVKQLEEVYLGASAKYNSLLDGFNIDDEKILNPSLWQ